MKPVVRYALGSAALLSVMASCKGRSPATGASGTKSAAGYTDSIDTAAGEKLWEGEEAEANKIKDAIVSTVHETGGPGVTPALHPAEKMNRRDAHPKAHGCVAAKFQVLPNLEPALAKGLFSSPGEFDATIRFSNGNGDPTRHDIKGDGRGMAIKVRGVSGNRLVEGAGTDTQDFVMINFPMFFVAKPQSYLPIVKAVADGSILGAAQTVLWEPRDAWVIAQLATIKILNPVQEQYWSEVAYRLGEQGDGTAIKFSAKPVACPGSDPMPLFLVKKAKLVEMTAASLVSDADHDFLRKALVKSLDPAAQPAKQACFDFMVQPATQGDSVEDPRWEWKGEFKTVAKITVKAQAFDKPDQDMACEKLSYSPWDGISAHRPLGGVNRIRRVVYEAVSNKRHGIAAPAQ